MDVILKSYEAVSLTSLVRSFDRLDEFISIAGSIKLILISFLQQILYTVN